MEDIDSLYYYEELESEEDGEEEDEDECDEEDEEDEEEVQFNSVRVSVSNRRARGAYPISSQEVEREKRIWKREGVGNRGEESAGGGGEGNSQGRQQWNRTEIDGLFCPICMEAWTSEGSHHICCLPCGHLFGMSCIIRWIKQRGSSAKCPQCNSNCTLKDIRKLFASSVAVVDEESQKRIRSLETKCALLEKQGATWCMIESEWKKREVQLQNQVYQLTERATYLERLFGDLQRSSELVTPSGHTHAQCISGDALNSNSCKQLPSSFFALEAELQVHGGRLFEIDASGQMLLLSRRLPGIGGSHVLTKISLISSSEREDISLPSSTKFVKDLRISPADTSLALCASLSKKLLVLSTESKNVVLSYDLPAPVWSCSWDFDSSHNFYAGLQNGVLSVFDIRQTVKPVESYLGLSTHPIHTIHSLRQNSTLPSGSRSVLSASSIGVCQWNCGAIEESGPFLVHEAQNEGVCISLAYCASNDDLVASYRPRVDMSNEITASQIPFTPVVGQAVQGSHLHLKRVGSKYEKLGNACTAVSDIRLPKSTIIEREKQLPLLAVGDEATCGLVLKELPSFTVVQCLKPHTHYICDVKYASIFSSGFLGCLSENRLQIYRTDHL